VSNYDGASWVLNNMEAPSILFGNLNVHTIFGDSNACGASRCEGYTAINTNLEGNFRNGFGLSIALGATNENEAYSVALYDRTAFNASHVLVRTSDVVDVPEPSTLAILALGLFGLAARQRKNDVK